MQTFSSLRHVVRSSPSSGCRHSRSGTSCEAFVNRQAMYLADKYEPVTSEMCLRAASVHTLLSHVHRMCCDVIASVERGDISRTDDEISGKVNKAFDQCSTAVTNICTSMVKLMVHKVQFFCCLLSNSLRCILNRILCFSGAQILH